MDEESLRTRLRGVKRLLVLGVGNQSQGDDGAGVALARRLKRKWRSSNKFRAIDAGLTPENSIAEIRRFDPSHVLLVDAADTGSAPGSVGIIETNMIQGIVVSTHGLSLSLIADYIEKEIGAKVTVLGIQPLRLTPGGRISRVVCRTLDTLEGLLMTLSRRGA